MAAADRADRAAVLRIIHITDVYKLDNFPRLHTLVAEQREALAKQYGAGAKLLTILTGDFLAPYLLMTREALPGRGMMDQINATPVDVLTFGNHDINDLDMKHLKRSVPAAGTQFAPPPTHCPPSPAPGVPPPPALSVGVQPRVNAQSSNYKGRL